MSDRYRGHPDAVRALVHPDRVHRDLYIDDEIFVLEQEHFFANTWNYVGNDTSASRANISPLTSPDGPLVVVATTTAVSLREPLRHRGRGYRATAGTPGDSSAALPRGAYTREGPPGDPGKKSDEGRAADCEGGPGMVAVRQCQLPRFVFRQAERRGPASRVLRDRSVDRQPRPTLAEGRAKRSRGCCASCTPAKGRCRREPERDTMHRGVHGSAGGTARPAEGTSREVPKGDGDRAVGLRLGLQVLRGMGRACVRNGHSYLGREF